MSTATDLGALAFDATTERLIANARQTALLDAARELLIRQPKTPREAAAIVANLDGDLIEFDSQADTRCNICGAQFSVGAHGECPKCASNELSSTRG